MKLKKLEIHGSYKNFHNLKIDFGYCNGVSAFIGNNGSGKSNILEVFSSIFKSLFLEEKDEFPYLLEYETFNNTTVAITSNGTSRAFAVNGNPVFDIKDHLPKRIIAIYSGEEDRLWQKYYRPVYLNYIAGVNQANVLEYPKMFYLNKFYWNLILLSLLISDADDVKDFIKNKLGIVIVNEIRFKFFKDKYKDYNNSPALSFIKRIDDVNTYSLETFKAKIGGAFSSTFSNAFAIGYDSADVFRSLYIAFTPADKKIIDDVEIIFNNGVNVSSLSEGQKKLLLIKATLEFASSEDTLILLDEPDAHIHISNKDQIIKVFEPYEGTRQIIITTHSPTLTQSFKDENVFMLTNGELIKKDRQYIINELTKEFWSKQEQNAFLSEVKDTILVEGKTDIIHLENALYKLSSIDEKYKNLNFKYLPFNGASGLKLFVDEFPINAPTFAFVDRDQAGLDAIKETLGFQGKKDEFHGQTKNGIYINFIPKKDGYTTSDFVIEDYYPIERYKSFLFENVSCLTEMPNYTKSNFKKAFAEKTKTYDVIDFEGFKKLFDLILTLKQNTSNQQKTNEKRRADISIEDKVALPVLGKDKRDVTNNEAIKKTKESPNKSKNQYSEKKHLMNKPVFVKKLYENYKAEILKLSDDIEVQPKKDYIAFKKKTNIVDICVQLKGLKIWINLKKGELKEPKKLMRDVSNTGHWGNGDYEIFVTDIENMEYIMSLIKQAIK